MPSIEVAVEMKARKYFMIEAKNQKEALKIAEQMFSDLWPGLDEDLMKREGISIDEDAKFLVTNVER